eukprot:TRINITY_DN53208_c0_g1_i1.p2 TRINITY_DN53208_c0_g1~~TRINITY_DN53208_c0_g1_i1.p2  ORF type:complete len:102 (-),score=14.62 TRINITY_DN53208_c0_g1_i1:94-399(-)
MRQDDNLEWNEYPDWCSRQIEAGLRPSPPLQSKQKTNPARAGYLESASLSTHLLLVPDAQGFLPIHLAVLSHFEVGTTFPWRVILKMVRGARVRELSLIHI